MDKANDLVIWFFQRGTQSNCWPSTNRSYVINRSLFTNRLFSGQGAAQRFLTPYKLREDVQNFLSGFFAGL